MGFRPCLGIPWDLGFRSHWIAQIHPKVCKTNILIFYGFAWDPCILLGVYFPKDAILRVFFCFEKKQKKFVFFKESLITLFWPPNTLYATIFSKKMQKNNKSELLMWVVLFADFKISLRLTHKQTKKTCTHKSKHRVQLFLNSICNLFWFFYQLKSFLLNLQWFLAKFGIPNIIKKKSKTHKNTFNQLLSM